jgi:hypothetical protein
MLAVPAEMARYLTLSVVQPDAEWGQRGESAGKRQRLAHCGAAPASSSHDATMTTQTPQSRGKCCDCQ